MYFFCILDTFPFTVGCRHILVYVDVLQARGVRGGGSTVVPPSLGFGSITKFVQDILDLKIFEIFTDAELGSLLIISFFRVRSFA